MSNKKNNKKVFSILSTLPYDNEITTLLKSYKTTSYLLHDEDKNIKRSNNIPWHPDLFVVLVKSVSLLFVTSKASPFAVVSSDCCCCR